MTPEQLQDGADWLYQQYYRLDRIILRSIRAVFSVGLLPAYLNWRLNLTYRYDNIREGIVGRNPAVAERAGLADRAIGKFRRLFGRAVEKQTVPLHQVTSRS